MNIMIGSDPEVFVSNGKGVFVSAHDLIPGTKADPYPVPRGAIQVDGVAAEFNIDPAETVDQFTKNIRAVMNSLEEFVRELQPDYSLSIIPTAHFEKGYFDALPEEVKLLGCTPDFDAYTGEENTSPDTTETFRTGAGHIHIGWGNNLSVTDEGHIQNCRQLVKELDCTLYPSSLLWDDDNKRRTLYGKMGSFRPKSYGVEYRPISNAYLKDKSTQEFVFNTTKHVSDLFFRTGTRIANDPVAMQYVENTLLDKQISQVGLVHYLKYIGKTYDTPVFHRG
jgi:hypothetical protein